MKVVLYFGTFNPVHTGHLIIAESVLNETTAQQVWLIVSPQNPFKVRSQLLGEYDRLRLCELALEGNERIFPSNVEFMLPRPSYTMDTLTHLAAQYPTYEFGICMGQDNLYHLHKWKNYEALLKYYAVYVYPRLGYEPPANPQPQHGHPHVHTIDCPMLEISSTQIRNLLAGGKSIRYLVPEAVADYIYKHHLYGG